jgi:hypothetical protein
MRRRTAASSPSAHAPWKRRAWVGTIILTLLIAGVAIAGQQTAGKKKPGQTAAMQAAPHVLVVNAPPSAVRQTPAPPPGQGGWRVAIDPVTGQFRDLEPSEAAALSGTVATSAPAAPAAEIAGPNGAVGIVLDESQMNYSVAHKHADGSVSTQCVENHAAAQKALAARPKKEGRHER